MKDQEPDKFSTTRMLSIFYHLKLSPTSLKSMFSGNTQKVMSDITKPIVFKALGHVPSQCSDSNFEKAHYFIKVSFRPAVLSSSGRKIPNPLTRSLYTSFRSTYKRSL
ncbi:hypothetical protein L2E82_12075 [Cichorium intybus]|uniref:Uncharacterized protein n=1 Tax=Cichorium intybus TaxID=13427 RepID=A0ACB9GG57_CICIN|nr:hypothetical protein L2E82_12075 [Cichorium intybus]